MHGLAAKSPIAYWRLTANSSRNVEMVQKDNVRKDNSHFLHRSLISTHHEDAQCRSGLRQRPGDIRHATPRWRLAAGIGK
jgi:hypothetical protein